MRGRPSHDIDSVYFEVGEKDKKSQKREEKQKEVYRAMAAGNGECVGGIFSICCEVVMSQRSVKSKERARLCAL